jgi:hypothetical protein
MHRSGNHRADWRVGPWQAFCRRKADILRKLVAPGRVLERFVADARRVAVDTYHIPAGSALFLRAKAALDDFRPLADDTEGEVFE